MVEVLFLILPFISPIVPLLYIIPPYILFSILPRFCVVLTFTVLLIISALRLVIVPLLDIIPPYVAPFGRGELKFTLEVKVFV